MDFSQKYNVYAPNTRKKAKCVAERTMYQNQLFHPYGNVCRGGKGYCGVWGTTICCQGQREGR